MEKKMTEFVPVSAPSEMDFYQIYQADGGKRIRILGFLMEREPNEDGQDLRWGLVDCRGIDLSLAEFVKGASEKGGREFATELEERSRQWQMDLSDADAVSFINTYFGGDPADCWLGFDEVDLYTPCGCYVA